MVVTAHGHPGTRTRLIPTREVTNLRLGASFRLLTAAALAIAALTGCGSGQRQPLVVGAVEDSAMFGDADGEMALAADSGFGAVALSAVWTRGLRAPPPEQLAGLARATAAATRHDIRPIVAVYFFSSNTPTTVSDEADFAAYAASLARGLHDVRDVIVGNEPNLNRFFLPQYGPAGEDIAATSFERLLAATYDALKAVDPAIQVIGAGLAPRGSDNPASARATHSPSRFLMDLGTAYRKSGRRRPIMDALSIHPYGESSRIAPTLRHPRTSSIGIADYPKLVDLLGQAFGDSAQRGRDLPIVYGEYGVETTIPPAKLPLYSGTEIVNPVDETTQARYYETAIRLASCQPTVEMLLLFHVRDEPLLTGLQSGTRYVDGTPKASLAPVRRFIRETTSCP
jgi:hypothetical protein